MKKFLKNLLTNSVNRSRVLTVESNSNNNTTRQAKSRKGLKKMTKNEVLEMINAKQNRENNFINITDEEVEEMTNAINTVEKIAAKVEQTKTRSAWDRGVKAYAEELAEELSGAVRGGWIDETDISNRRLMEKAMLNGADSWNQYSEGGCALCYDGQIAERLCAPWELRKTDNGRKEPNPRESWIDVQSRALYQAAQLVLNAAF